MEHGIIVTHITRVSAAKRFLGPAVFGKSDGGDTHSRSLYVRLSVASSCDKVSYATAAALLLSVLRVSASIFSRPRCYKAIYIPDTYGAFLRVQSRMLEHYE